MTVEDEGEAALKKTRDGMRRHLRRANNLAIHYKAKLRDITKRKEPGDLERPLFRFGEDS